MSRLAQMSNLEYHGDKTHLSSSGLKLLLKDTPAFHDQYILGNQKQSDANHFAEGTFVHSLILEPEKVSEQYAIFEGLRKAGKAYEDFVRANSNKMVLSSAQVLRCEKLYASWKAHNIASTLIQNGLSEHTLTSNILDVAVKCRADYLVPKKYIVDVKTTAAASDSELFKSTMHMFGYALSAALYAQIAYDNYEELHEFYFVVLSKQDFGCRVYRASSETLSLGLADVMSAVVKYKRCVATNDWSGVFSNSLLEQLEVEEV